MEDSYCSNCGQLMQADANYCSGCGKPKSGTLKEGSSPSDEEVKARVETDALKAEGMTGQKDVQTASSACCPHCSVNLDPVPRRKKKCPSCGNDIYVRTDPRSQQTLLLRKEDALHMDALQVPMFHYTIEREVTLSMKVVRNLNLEKEFEEAKRKAPWNQTIGDVVWGLLNGRKHMAARNGDWQTVSGITYAQARLRYELGKDYFPLLQASMKEQLKGALATGVANHAQIVSSRDDRVCEKCRSQDGMVFTIQYVMEKMPLPVRCDSEEGWCRCTYVYSD